MMLTITTKNFENDVLHADKPVLVDFWACLLYTSQHRADGLHHAGEHAAEKRLALALALRPQGHGDDRSPVSYTHLVFIISFPFSLSADMPSDSSVPR